MTNPNDLTLEERVAMQYSLAADRKENIANWRSYKEQYPDVENAGSKFVHNILDAEIKMEFNAAAIRAAEREAIIKAAENGAKNPPTLPRYRGH